MKMQFFSIYGPRIISESEEDISYESLPNNITDMVQNIFNVITNPTSDTNMQNHTNLRNANSSSTSNTNSSNETNTTNPPSATATTTTTTTDNTFSFLNPIQAAPRLSIQELSQNTSLEICEINEDEMLEEGMTNQMQCAICHTDIQNNTIVRKINICGHQFHPHCIDRWFENNSTCPLCRQSVLSSRPSSSSSSSNESVYTIPITFSYI